MKKKPLTKENWKSQIENKKILFPILSITNPRRQRLSSDEPQQTIVRREEKLREREMWKERERRGEKWEAWRERGRWLRSRNANIVRREIASDHGSWRSDTNEKREKRKKAVARERRGGAREDREWRREKTKFQLTIMGRPKS